MKIIENHLPRVGDYVVATKYEDGDPGDHYCVGFYDGSYEHFGKPRHLVVDSEGKQFRANGFRRVKRISRPRGALLVRNFAKFDDLKDKFSVWHWVALPPREFERALM